MDLRELLNPTQGLLDLLSTACLSKAGLAEGTNAATIQIAAPNGAGIDFAIGGVLYHKADTDNIALTAAAAQADGTTCWYLICINAAGTVSSVKGTDDGDIPEPTSGTCPIGAIKVVTDGGTFTAGTTDLGDAAVTDTYYDFMHVPRGGAADLS